MNEQIVRQARAQKIYEQRHEQFGHLPQQVLLDLARNEGATREMRRAAVEIMMEKGFNVSHPDLALLVLEIKSAQDAKQEVEAIAETAVEGELEAEQTGPFKASVTTASLGRSENE